MAAIRMRPHLPHAFGIEDAAEDTWERALFATFSGMHDTARIGRVPRWIAKALGCSTTIVYMNSTTAKKIRGKHKITFAELRALADVLDTSEVARDSRLDLAFWFPSPARQTMIKAVVKTTKQKDELWLKTMHPINKTKLDAVKKKVMVLRGKKEDAN